MLHFVPPFHSNMVVISLRIINDIIYDVFIHDVILHVITIVSELFYYFPSTILQSVTLAYYEWQIHTIQWQISGKVNCVCLSHIMNINHFISCNILCLTTFYILQHFVSYNILYLTTFHILQHLYLTTLCQAPFQLAVQWLGAIPPVQKSELETLQMWTFTIIRTRLSCFNVKTNCFILR